MPSLWSPLNCRFSRVVVDLDYIESGYRECPLIRLKSTHSEDFYELRKSIEQVRLGNAKTLQLDKLPFINSLDAISLRLVLGATKKRIGVRKIKGAAPGVFEWILPEHMWEWVEDLIKPFESPEAGGSHQYLAGCEARGLLGDSLITVIISTLENGAW